HNQRWQSCGDTSAGPIRCHLGAIWVLKVAELWGHLLSTHQVPRGSSRCHRHATNPSPRPSPQASPSLTPTHQAGVCAFYGECGTNPEVNVSLVPSKVPCLSNTPARVASGALLALLRSVCPELVRGDNDTTRVCCSYGQLVALRLSVGLSGAVLARCPACARNFANLYCPNICSCAELGVPQVESKVTLALGGILVVLGATLASMGLLALLGLPWSLIIIEVVPFLVLAVGADNIFIFVQEFQGTCGVTPLSPPCGCWVGDVALYGDARRELTQPHTVTPSGTPQHPEGARVGDTAPRGDTRGCWDPFGDPFWDPFVPPVGAAALTRGRPQDSYMLQYFSALNQYLAVGVPTYFITTGGYNFSSANGTNAICSSAGCDADSLTRVPTGDLSCQQCLQWMRRPTAEEFQRFLPWFLQDRPNLQCAKGCVAPGVAPRVAPCWHREGPLPSGLPSAPRVPAVPECPLPPWCPLPSGLPSAPMVPIAPRVPRAPGVTAALRTALCPQSARCPRVPIAPMVPAALRTPLCPHGAHCSQSAPCPRSDRCPPVPAASRFMAYQRPLRTSQEFTAALRAARALAERITHTLRRVPGTDPAFRVFPYTVTYVYYEQYLTVVYEGLVMLALCLVPTFAVSFLLLGMELHSSLATLLTIAMVLLDTVGCMALWSVPYNAVALINLVAAVGISVEFVSHITCAFAHSRQPTRVARATEATVTMGSKVVAGVAMTNLPGVVVLAFAKARLVQIFFVRLNLIITLVGLAHGLVFLPVLLSYIGTGRVTPPGDRDGLAPAPLFPRVTPGDRDGLAPAPLFPRVTPGDRDGLAPAPLFPRVTPGDRDGLAPAPLFPRVTPGDRDGLAPAPLFPRVTPGDRDGLAPAPLFPRVTPGDRDGLAPAPLFPRVTPGDRDGLAPAPLFPRVTPGDRDGLAPAPLFPRVTPGDRDGLAPAPLFPRVTPGDRDGLAPAPPSWTG
ncbi:PREDICTED: Niemann-Pick C1-like protein 1, partial [Corvus brachyrhynchos]|uniref:Niemann-Pick C1-like protein 1 n=1 Tax=Corvus brachyrhynchos TaxID=85066 RepID=UPI0008165FD0